MKIDLEHFDTLIFDFGGVILDIEPERTRSAFAALVGEDLVEQVFSSHILTEFEKGRINAFELQAQIEQITRIPIQEEVFKRAWTAMLVDYKPKRIERIQWLAQKHKLIMLSNTNEIHYAFFSQKLQKEYGLTFSSLFNEVYLSHEMGLLKPDKEIFRRVLVEQHLNPEKTLFIEDTRENADAAKLLGIETLLIPRNANFYDYFL